MSLRPIISSLSPTMTTGSPHSTKLSSSTVFVAPSPLSFWRLFLFNFAFPSITDSWRLWISSQSSGPLGPALRIIHRSLKILYRCIAWLAMFPYQRKLIPTSELERSLTDVRNNQKTPGLVPYRDDDDDDEDDVDDEDERSEMISSTLTNEDSGLHPSDTYEFKLSIWRVDWVLQNSSRLQAVNVVSKITDFEVEEIVSVIIAVKRVNNMLAPTLTECLRKIKDAAHMRQAIEERSQTKYDPNLHRTRLTELWQLLKTDQVFEGPPAKLWQQIGFQGADPATDFRGAGLLGLDALLVFARYYGEEARNLVTEAVDGGPSWYPWALASINVTWWCQNLLKEGKIRFFLLSSSSKSFSSSPKGRREELLKDLPDQLDQFLFLQIKLTYLFHHYWRRLEPVPTVMEFEEKFKIFKAKVSKSLVRGIIGGFEIGWIFEDNQSGFGDDRPKRFIP